MARGSQEAQGAARLGLSTAKSGYGTLMPELRSDIINPTGMTEQDIARATTAAQQSAGGATAGATGQGALLAGRTRNPGSAQAAVAQSARNAGEELQKNALGVRLADAELKQDKRSRAMGMLGQAAGEGLGAVAPSVQADAAAKEASWGWAKHILGPVLGAAGGAAGGYFGGGRR